MSLKRIALRPALAILAGTLVLAACSSNPDRNDPGGSAPANDGGGLSLLRPAPLFPPLLFSPETFFPDRSRKGEVRMAEPAAAGEVARS